MSAALAETLSIVIATLDTDDAATLAAHGVSPVVLGLDANEWADRTIIEALEGQDVILMPPSEAEFDESINVRQIVRDAVTVLGPHCLSFRIGGGWGWSTPADIEAGALSVADWSKDRAKPLGRWTPLLFDDTLPAVDSEWLIKNVLPARGVAFLFGPSASGKTFCGSDMAVHIAQGRPWRGHLTTQRAVMWVAAEAPQGMRKRLFAIRMRHPSKTPTPFALFSVTPDLRTGIVDRQDLVGAVIETAQQFEVPIGLIVIDTLAQVLNGGSDIAMEDMGAVLANARAIEEATGALVLLVHHTGHSEQDRMRGHSSMHAAADAVLGVKADPESKSRTITLHKLKDGESGAAWGFELEQVSLGTDGDGDPVTTCIVQPADIAASPARPTRRARSQGEIDRALALSTLCDVIVKAGGNPPAGVTTSRHHSKVVTRDNWRDACYASGFRAEDDPAKRRTAFWRASSALCDDGEVIEQGGFVSIGPPK
ncbi:MAG: AAA family ATPase [Micropepsaceae bacterium]